MHGLTNRVELECFPSYDCTWVEESARSKRELDRDDPDTASRHVSCEVSVSFSSQTSAQTSTSLWSWRGRLEVEKSQRGVEIDVDSRNDTDEAKHELEDISLRWYWY